MLGFNKDSLETPDSSLYHCGLNPFVSIVLHQNFAKHLMRQHQRVRFCLSILWKPIPQTEDEINEQLRLDYEEEEWWEEAVQQVSGAKNTLDTIRVSQWETE